MTTGPARIANPGESIRSYRRARKWTLEELGQRTGLPVSTLSRLETGRIAPSFDKLQRVSDALGLDMAQLLNGRTSAPAGGKTGRRAITRAGDGRAVKTPHYAHQYLATDLLNKRLTPIIAELSARTLAEFGELIRHEGEEFTLVLEGEVEVHCDTYEPVRLKTGDSIYFDSTMGHAYLAAAPGPCRILCVSSSIEVRLDEQR
jgi:transcriptional regulator with XRE-family HTH domain